MTPTMINQLFFFFTVKLEATNFFPSNTAEVRHIYLKMGHIMKPEDHWSCIAHLIAKDVLKSAVIEEKKFKNIECK